MKTATAGTTAGDVMVRVVGNAQRREGNVSEGLTYTAGPEVRVRDDDSDSDTDYGERNEELLRGLTRRR